jgi:hypothetical protein
MERRVNRFLALLLALIGTAGFALLITLVSDRFVSTQTSERITVGVLSAGCAIVLFTWFSTRTSLSGSLKAFRLLMVVEFFVFAIEGILVSFGRLQDLYR